MPTTNYYIKPSDGWVQIADSPKFIRTSGYPHTHPYYLASGSSAPSLVATAATGTATFSVAVPSDGDTVTVGTEVYTFRTTPSLPFEVAIGADFHASATNLTAYVNAYSAIVKATDVSDVVTFTAIAVGSQGNYALAKSSSNIAVSGAALTGGTDVKLGVLMCHHPFKVNVTMAEKLYARVPNSVRDSNNGSGQLRLDVFTIT